MKRWQSVAEMLISVDILLIFCRCPLFTRSTEIQCDPMDLGQNISCFPPSHGKKAATFSCFFASLCNTLGLRPLAFGKLQGKWGGRSRSRPTKCMRGKHTHCSSSGNFHEANRNAKREIEFEGGFCQSNVQSISLDWKRTFHKKST